METKRVLVIDDEDSICRVLRKHLQEKGYEATTALNAGDGLAALAGYLPQVVILDIRLPDTDGLTLLRRLRERYPETFVIIITAFGDMETTIAAMQQGAYDYLRKPIDIEELDRIVEMCFRTVEERHHSSRVVVPAAGERDGRRVVGSSRKMQEIFKIVGAVSNSRTTVLIQGETGTGKELIAHAIHDASPARRSPFITINCGALIETLLASELFGHEKGAFTGAIAHKKGKFEVAGDGTIFLDEVHEMTVANQVKLLRVLQEREFERVGGNQTLRTNARILSACAPPLDTLVAQGRFREDLYYRLKVVTLNLPPLRERREDIPALVEFFIQRVSRELNKSAVRIPDETMTLLARREWKGNVRELENTVRRALVMCKGDTLFPAFMDAEEPREALPAAAAGAEAPLKDLDAVEADHIRRVLEHTGWNKFEASRILHISRPTLDRKIKEYKLTPS